MYWPWPARGLLGRVARIQASICWPVSVLLSSAVAGPEKFMSPPGPLPPVPPLVVGCLPPTPVPNGSSLEPRKGLKELILPIGLPKGLLRLPHGLAPKGLLPFPRGLLPKGLPTFPKGLLEKGAPPPPKGLPPAKGLAPPSGLLVKGELEVRAPSLS